MCKCITLHGGGGASQKGKNGGDLNSSISFLPSGQFGIVCISPWLLGGLSLHLNHLIASRMANYDWPFGTLPFGLFGPNLDTRDLEAYPRTYSGHF